MNVGEIIKRILSGVFLTIPLLIIGLVISLFAFGLSIPPTTAQLLIVGGAGAFGFFLGFAKLGFSNAILDFLSAFSS